MEHDGISDVRNGDAVAYGGGLQRLARQQTCSRNSRSTVSGRRSISTTFRRTTGLFAAGDAVKNAAEFEGIGQFRKRAGLAFRLLEDARRDIDAVGCGPFNQLRAIEAILAVQPVARQFALFNPAINCLFRDIQQSGNFSDRNLHLLLMPKRLNSLWTFLDILQSMPINVKPQRAPCARGR